MPLIMTSAPRCQRETLLIASGSEKGASALITHSVVGGSGGSFRRASDPLFVGAANRKGASEVGLGIFND